MTACATAVKPTLVAISDTPVGASDDIYGEIDSEPFPVAAIDTSDIDPELLRQTVAYDGGHAPGTVVVDPDKRFLYHVGERGRATRYGVGVGREGFAWSGRARIGRKGRLADLDAAIIDDQAQAGSRAICRRHARRH